MGELLLSLDEVSLAIDHLRHALKVRVVLAQELNHHLSGGEENAKLALSAIQTNLALALVSNPLRYPGHHLEYRQAKELVDSAYATRMKYLGVRHDLTAYTMDIQGTVQELEEDYQLEKETIIKEDMYVYICLCICACVCA